MIYSLLVACSACLLSSCQARIGMRGATRNELISIETVDTSLLSELAGALGQSNQARIKRIEDEMRPMFMSFPKTSDGMLNQAGVRYALHRFFVQLHGWHVKGLEPDGASRASSSPTDMLKDRVPAHVINLVEEHLHGRGFGLHELAMLAATLDDLIHSEAMARLTKAYAAHDVPVLSKTTAKTADLIIQTYMVFYLLPHEKLLKFTSSQLKRLMPKISKVYPGWDDTMMWVRDLQKSMEYNERFERNPFKTATDADEVGISFDSIARVIEEVNGKFGRFQDLECRGMKSALTDIEDGETGRVLLSTFYGNALEGAWQFQESVEYLRELGALDDSVAERPSVVIPNYLNGRSNCLAASSFYSVCCIDECEEIMSRIEGQIESPLGAPTKIAQLVARVSTDTIDAPRNLSSPLLARLNDIATHHGGKVPLHGRLFAQWLHHAFPRECPMPKLTSSAPMTASEWMQATNATKSATRKEMEAHVNKSTVQALPSQDSAGPAELPWSQEEELVMIVDSAATEAGWFASALRCFACLTVLVSAGVSLMKSSKTAFAELPMYSGGGKTSRFAKAHFV